MSLNDVFDVATAARVAQLERSDVDLIIKAAALGMKADAVYDGAVAIADGQVVELPKNLGAPRPVTINAWSFVNDRGQYHATYGLTDVKAAELKTLLRDSTDEGLKQIHDLVSAALRKRGSERPVAVSRDGMPGSSGAAQLPGPGRQGGATLKAEIIRNPQLYGMYKFEAVDSGRPGPMRFKVALGAGLYATFPNKSGAIDVARICRVNGRDYPVIAGRVAFWREGKAPLTGGDIPESVKFDGKLGPGEQPPAEPVSKAATEAPPK